MLPFGVAILATVPQGSEIPEGLMNNPVYENCINREWQGQKPYVKFGIRAIAESVTACQSSIKLAVPLLNTEHKVRNCR